MPLIGAILVAVWEFLVAFAPVIVAIGTTLVELASALFALAKIAAVVAVIAAIIEILFDPRGRKRIGTLLANIVGGALDNAKPLLDDLAPALSTIGGEFRDALNTHGAGIVGELGGDFQALAKSFLEAQRGGLSSLGESTPDNALDTAATAFQVAFGTGLASHGVAVLFEAVFPKSLNSLDGLAPVLGEMAGFKEVAAHVIDPLYSASFGKALEYKYNSTFKPEFASEDDAVRWHSRRLLSDDDLREVFKWSPLKAKYEGAFVDSAYVPINPRALATAFVDVDFPRDRIRKIMEFAGNRDADIDLMLDAMEQRSVQNLRAQLMAAIEVAGEKGIYSPADVDNALIPLQVSAAASNLVHLTIATKKLVQLDDLYRKSVSEAYKTDQITDADYVAHLEAIGIAEADADAHYAVDSIAKHGREAAAAVREAKMLAATQQRAAVAAARAQYSAGSIDAPAFAAELLAAGLSAPLIVFATAIATARRQGSLTHIYGQQLSPADAEVLRREVAAIGEQTVKALIPPAQAIGQLAALNVPGPIREALAAKWAAQGPKTLLPS